MELDWFASYVFLNEILRVLLRRRDFAERLLERRAERIAAAERRQPSQTVLAADVEANAHALRAGQAARLLREVRSETADRGGHVRSSRRSVRHEIQAAAPFSCPRRRGRRSTDP